jgi:uncharacterized RmlC-like cupin family protein
LHDLERRYTLPLQQKGLAADDRRNGYDQLGKGKSWVRGASGESYQDKQGPNYTPGISAESAVSQAIWLGSGTLPPHGGRTKAHLHENHETAIYLLSGDEVELSTVEQLERREIAHPGDYFFFLRLSCSSS